MDRPQIEREVLAVVREQKTLPDAPLDPSASLADAGIDSLDALNILFALEEKFHISIPDERAREIRTLDDLTGIIESLLSSESE